MAALLRYGRLDIGRIKRLRERQVDLHVEITQKVEEEVMSTERVRLRVSQ